MIRLATDKDSSALSEFLHNADINSALFHEALIGTYGLSQPFFKVYIQVSDGITACLSLLDTSGFLTLSKASDTEELISFLQLNPLLQSVAMDKSDFFQLDKIDGSNVFKAELLRLERNIALPEIQRKIDMLPKMDDIYNIMTDHFELRSRDEFKSDMLHRINHGRGAVAAIYIDGMVASCASVFFRGNRAALIGGVCTSSAFRKRGLASQIVARLCLDLRKDNILPLITCKSEVGKRVYRTLGFTAAGERITLTKGRF